MTLFAPGITHDFDLLRMYPQRTYLLASASGTGEDGAVRALASVLKGFILTYEQYMTPDYLQAKLDRSVKLLLDAHVEYQKAMAAEDEGAMEHWWNELNERREMMHSDRDFMEYLGWFRAVVLPRRLKLNPSELVDDEKILELLEDGAEPTMLNVLWALSNNLNDHRVVAVPRSAASGRRPGLLRRLGIK